MNIALANVLLWAAIGEAGTPASAADRVYLEWQAAPETTYCLAPDAAVENVERALGRRVFYPREEAHRTLRVTLASEPAGYAAHIELVSSRATSLGERDLVMTRESCADTLTVTLSIMADLPRSDDEADAALVEDADATTLVEDTSAAATALVEDRRRVRASRARRKERRNTSLRASAGLAATLERSANASPGTQVMVRVDRVTFAPVLVSMLSTLRPHAPFAGEARLWLSSTRIDLAVCTPPWLRPAASTSRSAAVFPVE